MELSRHITIYTKQFYLIEVVKHLLTTILIKIKWAWVKGHSQSKKPTLQEDLNIMAEKLAGGYESFPDPSFQQLYITICTLLRNPPG